jgi:hypothetical protein
MDKYGSEMASGCEGLLLFEIVVGSCLSDAQSPLEAAQPSPYRENDCLLTITAAYGRLRHMRREQRRIIYFDSDNSQALRTGNNTHAPTLWHAGGSRRNNLTILTNLEVAPA